MLGGPIVEFVWRPHFMDLNHIAELLKPFLSPRVHNITVTSCADPHAAESEAKDGSRKKTHPGDAGASDIDRQSPAILSSAQLSNISTYIDLLMRWNLRINLTAIRDPEQIVTRHFGESLFAALHLFPTELASTIPASAATTRVAPGLRPGDPDQATEIAAHHLLDIGSGAGFPALPMKIWAPQLHLTLVESNQKKATFLREVSRTLTLTNINVLNSRAEDLPAATAHTVTLRAVESFHAILPIARGLSRPGGRLALLIGESQLKQTQDLANIKWSYPISIPQSTSRLLLVGTRTNGYE